MPWRWCCGWIGCWRATPYQGPGRDPGADRSGRTSPFTASRQREQLRQHRQRLEAQGRSLLLYYGCRVLRPVVVPAKLARGQKSAGRSAVQALLATLRELIETVNEKLTTATQQLEAVPSLPQPMGFGALSSELLRREVGDWGRFKNRREVAKPLKPGCVPRVRASGNQQQCKDPSPSTVIRDTATRLDRTGVAGRALPTRLSAGTTLAGGPPGSAAPEPAKKPLSPLAANWPLINGAWPPAVADRRKACTSKMN